MKYICLIITTFLFGCANISEQQKNLEPVVKKNLSPLQHLGSKVFGKPANIIPVEKIFELTDVQKRNFLVLFNSIEYADEKPNLRIFSYMERYLSDFNFYSDTLIAKESLSQGQGNCMSLAILAKSFANLAGLNDIAYQLWI